MLKANRLPCPCISFRDGGKKIVFKNLRVKTFFSLLECDENHFFNENDKTKNFLNYLIENDFMEFGGDKEKKSWVGGGGG